MEIDFQIVLNFLVVCGNTTYYGISLFVHQWDAIIKVRGTVDLPTEN